MKLVEIMRELGTNLLEDVRGNGKCFSTRSSDRSNKHELRRQSHGVNGRFDRLFFASILEKDDYKSNPVAVNIFLYLADIFVFSPALYPQWLLDREP